MRTIEVKAAGYHLSKDSSVAGVQGEANATVLRIEFGEDWDGCAKSVTFRDARGENPVVRVLTTDLLEDIQQSARVYLCPIPGEAMTEAGKCSFVIDGYLDGRRQRSLEDELIVKAAMTSDDAGEPVDPTPTQAEQLQTQIDGIVGDLQAAIESGDRAAASAAEAAESAENAAESEDAAALSQEAAKKSEEAAKTSETAAAKSETAAAASEEAAATSEQNAKASEEAAATSEGNALAAAEAAKKSEEAAARSSESATAAAESASLSAGAAANAASAASGSAEVAQEAAASAAGDAQRAEAAAEQAEQIAGGDWTTPEDVSGAIATHNTDETAHEDIREAVTEQGDALEEHVADTDAHPDLAPSFTEATSLTKLATGEKLSVLLGKIAKAVTDFIAHLADSVKHITATERTAWNAKQAAITGGATTITADNLTASRALVSDASGKVGVSAVTSTELGYLDGVTSAIQTQLNGKAASSHTHSYAAASHTHAAGQITAGTFAATGVVAAAGTDYTTQRVRNIGLVTAATNPSTNGAITFIYE